MHHFGIVIVVVVATIPWILTSSVIMEAKGKTLRTSRRKRSVVLPSGSDVEFIMALQIPISALSATSTTFDVDIPFVFDLPDSESKLMWGKRSIEDEHETLLKMAENLLNNFGFDGRSCILRLICELAESRGLPYNGLLGKAFELIFLLDYGFSTTDGLYEYIKARMYGENHGDCDLAYPQCPFSAFNLVEDQVTAFDHVFGGLNNNFTTTVSRRP